VEGEKLVTIPAAAERLHVSHMTIRRYIRDGLLKPIKPGRDYLIDVDQLDALTRPKPGPKRRPPADPPA
jgi:excisionase family DNA binding protein